MQFEAFSLTIHKRQIWTINSALEECFIMWHRKSERVMVLRSLATCVCVYPVRLSLYGTFNFLCAALLRSFICKSLECSTKAKANGKWGKTAIKKVAAPAYASSLRCRILKFPCKLSTGFSPHNPAKRTVRRGGRGKRLSLAA